MEDSYIKAMTKKAIILHNEWLKNTWNENVKKDETIICVGDFAFNNIYMHTEFLNGNKILIKGNHDSGKDAYKDIWKFVDTTENWTKDEIIFPKRTKHLACIIADVGNKKILFSHYPIITDEKYHGISDMLFDIFSDSKCDYNIHGHIHHRDSIDPRCINVSVERFWKPMMIKDLVCLK